MRPRDIRRRETADLVRELTRLREEIFQRRFHSQSEEKVDRGLQRRSRRDVARIKTILRERDMASTQSGAAPSSVAGEAK